MTCRSGWCRSATAAASRLRSRRNLLGRQEHMTVPNTILVQISSQVVKIVEQLPEALGVSQLSIVKNSRTVELQLERPVEQHLDLMITAGNPTPGT